MTKAKKAKQSSEPQFVVVSDRGGTRTYLGEDGAWWDDLADAKRYPTRGAAQRAMKQHATATGCIPAPAGSEVL